MQQLIHTISERTKLSEEAKQAIISVFRPMEVTKGDVILREGRVADRLYFVDTGVLHNYYLTDDRQVTSWFYVENQFNTAWSSFYTQSPSFEYVECLEDGLLYAITYTDYQKLIANHVDFGEFARRLAEEMLTAIDIFSKNWSFLSAKEKYTLLHQHFPQIELRVKLGLIASFLGISQATLSRVRAGK